MPKVTKEQVLARRKEILDACRKLYGKMSFGEITLKEIGASTSLTRTSIYNYFNTKEEIFLALLGEEFDLWTEELLCAAQACGKISRADFAQIIATTLCKRTLLLKVLSMNIYEIEAASRREKLVEFKYSFKRSLETVAAIMKNFSDDEKEINDFIYSFYPFIYGIYPYSSSTEKQKSAMAETGYKFRYMTAYELTLSGAKKLLGVD